jgi:secreted trypsin-like serine protease
MIKKNFVLLMSAVFVSCYIDPGEVTLENFDFLDSRIASGIAAKKGENLDFCYLSINFFNKQQSCGCLILSPDYVITSARCVVE